MARKRNKQIIFCLTEVENMELEKRIGQSGLKKGEYIRNCVLNKEIVNLDPIKELLPEMKRQGVNLNQIAKKLNSQGYVDYRNELKNALEGVQETWQLLRQYLHMHQ